MGSASLRGQMNGIHGLVIIRSCNMTDLEAYFQLIHKKIPIPGK